MRSIATVMEKREKSFQLITLPPTVSGKLHIGHVFSYTQADDCAF